MTTEAFIRRPILCYKKVESYVFKWASILSLILKLYKILRWSVIYFQLVFSRPSRNVYSNKFSNARKKARGVVYLAGAQGHVQLRLEPLKIESPQSDCCSPEMSLSPKFLCLLLPNKFLEVVIIRHQFQAIDLRPPTPATKTANEHAQCKVTNIGPRTWGTGSSLGPDKAHPYIFSAP